MPGNIIRPCLVGLAAVLLAGCSSLPNLFAASGQAPAEATAAGQEAEAVTVPAAASVGVAPALISAWDTQYSAVLSPPIEVRRQAKNDCAADGYEVAVVETMKLEGNVATAIFICRGDFE